MCLFIFTSKYQLQLKDSKVRSSWPERGMQRLPQTSDFTFAERFLPPQIQDHECRGGKVVRR